ALRPWPIFITAKSPAARCRRRIAYAKSAGGRGKSRLPERTQALLQHLIEEAVAFMPEATVHRLAAIVAERWLVAEVPLPSAACVRLGSEVRADG
ncbi:MAG TPA: hypothetical protein VK727_18975, partial [Steroidobacteraceae bacterium]|nr:hypothetical protein [Steroidobacteraceae bacterium]